MDGTFYNTGNFDPNLCSVDQDLHLRKIRAEVQSTILKKFLYLNLAIEVLVEKFHIYENLMIFRIHLLEILTPIHRKSSKIHIQCNPKL